MIDLFKKLFKRRGVDNTLYTCAIFLSLYGIIMIGSAAVGQTASRGPAYAPTMMFKQSLFVIVGLCLLYFFSHAFKRKWINYNSARLIYFLSYIPLGLCLFWDDSKGSYAWIHLGPFTIQPSEFVKIVIILVLSFYLGQLEEMCVIPNNVSKSTKDKMRSEKIKLCFIHPLCMAVAMFIFIALFQKDLGSALIFFFICGIVFLCTPQPFYIKFKKVVLAGLGILIVLGLFLGVFVLKDYQLGRIHTWLDPLSDPMVKGWQLVNGLIAYSYGGLFGKGYGSSIQKYGYIPESHNDFITAIIYEELGLFGFLLFLIPFCIIIYKCFIYGNKVRDTKSRLILYGIGAYFFAHLIVNVGGVTGFIPMTGVPLLLVSSGGSSTWAAMIAIGIAQSIIRRYNKDLVKEEL